jgi:hypothetical protein
MGRNDKHGLVTEMEAGVALGWSYEGRGRDGGRSRASWLSAGRYRSVGWTAARAHAIRRRAAELSSR